MMKHAIDWFEIPAADLERACAFYEKIFEFKLQPMELANRLRMAMFPVNPAESVGGALCHHPEFYTPSQTGTLVYLNADPDLAAVLGRVEKAGGKILVPKTQISPEYGFMAVFLDSEGNRVALHSRG
jgi:predicted enzyme related to lactoylglutathione lyase